MYRFYNIDPKSNKKALVLQYRSKRYQKCIGFIGRATEIVKTSIGFIDRATEIAEKALVL